MLSLIAAVSSSTGLSSSSSNSSDEMVVKLLSITVLVVHCLDVLLQWRLLQRLFLCQKRTKLFKQERASSCVDKNFHTVTCVLDDRISQNIFEWIPTLINSKSYVGPGPIGLLSLLINIPPVRA